MSTFLSRGLAKIVVLCSGAMWSSSGFFTGSVIMSDQTRIDFGPLHRTTTDLPIGSRGGMPMVCKRNKTFCIIWFSLKGVLGSSK